MSWLWQTVKCRLGKHAWVDNLEAARELAADCNGWFAGYMTRYRCSGCGKHSGGNAFNYISQSFR